MPSRYPRIRSFPRAALRKLRDGMTLEFWIGFGVFVMACLGALLLALYIQGAQQDREFRLHAQVATGYLIGESTCRNGTRYGHDYCYTIRFTTETGEEITFQARGLTSYRTGFRVLSVPMRVEYLPDRPTAARLAGEENGSFLLWLALAVLGFTLFCAVKFHQALRWRNTQLALLQRLDALLAEQRFDEALTHALAVPQADHREAQLLSLLLRLFNRKEIGRLRDILARPDVPDLTDTLARYGVRLADESARSA